MRDDEPAHAGTTAAGNTAECLLLIPVSDDFIEKVARAWASMDGRSAMFDSCKMDRSNDEEYGYFSGYIEDARELLTRAGLTLPARSGTKIAMSRRRKKEKGR